MKLIFSVIFLFFFAAQPCALAQISLGVSSSMSFGQIDYDASPTGHLELGTDGNVSAFGSGIAVGGFPNAGTVSVTGNTGTIDIRCASVVTLADNNSNSYDITDIEIAVNTGLPFGSAEACQGAGSGDPVALSLDLFINPNPTLFFGGRVSIDNTVTSGQFSTLNTGGTPLTLRVVFQ